VQGSTKSIPKDAMSSAQWTVFGKSGHVRLQTTGSNRLHHELRFDGFPANDYETLRGIFKDSYGIDLLKYNMSASGTQFGLSKMSGKKLTFRHCILEDAEEEGEVREEQDKGCSMSCLTSLAFSRISRYCIVLFVMMTYHRSLK
jgi:hypothetical protein